MRFWGIVGLFSPLIGLVLAAIFFSMMLNVSGFFATILFFLAPACAVLPIFVGLPLGIVLVVKANRRAVLENPTATGNKKITVLWFLISLVGIFLFIMLVKVLIAGLAKAMPV